MQISKEALIKNIKDLPPIPQIVSKLRSLLSDPDSSSKSIADLISMDEALTSRVLRVCNSPYFGLVQKIRSIHQAVTLLGIKTLYNLVLAGSISYLYQAGLRGYKLKRGELWEHSLFTAFCSKMIVKRKKYNYLDNVAFTAGILHDVGKLILNAYLSNEAEKVLDLIRNKNISLIRAEKEVFGFTHTEIGAAMAKKWEFTHDLIEGVLYHHNPFQSKDYQKLVCIVYISSNIAIQQGYGVGIDGKRARLSKKVLEAVKIDEAEIVDVIKLMKETFDPSALLL